MQCRTHVAQLGRMIQDFQKAGAEVVVILGDTQERAVKYAEQLKVPFPVLADAEFVVYRVFDLEKVAFVIQRTASVIVDRDGVIRYIKRATNPMTWLQESRELLEFVVNLENAA
jgi:peroxiredoxin